MPAFFQFTQGSESRVRPTDSSPLLGRYRAVPPRPGIGPRRPSSPLGLLSNGRDSIHVGYGALIVAEIEAGLLSDGSGEDDRAVGDSKWERLWQSYFIDLFVDPRPSAVKRVVDRWWSRYGLLVFLPAALVRLFYTVILGWSSTFTGERFYTKTEADTCAHSGRCVVCRAFPAVLVPRRRRRR